MKRPALISSFILFVALCMSTAYWTMQFIRPAPRATVAPARVTQHAPELSAAAGLLGGKGATAGDFQLTGIIIADHPAESIAIIAANGKPAKPFRVHAEIQAGVSVQEVQRDYVLLSEHGAIKRINLPENIKNQAKVNFSPPPQAVTPGSYPQPLIQSPITSAATGVGDGSVKTMPVATTNAAPAASLTSGLGQ